MLKREEPGGSFWFRTTRIGSELPEFGSSKHDTPLKSVSQIIEPLLFLIMVFNV